MSQSTPRAATFARVQPPRPLLSAIPYLLLAFCALLTALLPHPHPGQVAIDLGLTGLLAVWMLWWLTLHPAWWERPRPMAVFYVGLLVLLAILVIRAPWFGFFTPVGYYFAFRLLGWPWRMPGAAAMALISGTAQAYGVNKQTWGGVALYLAVLTLNVVLICMSTYVDWHGNQKSAEREQALLDSSEANRRLEAMLAENAGLHEQLLTQARETGVLDERRRMAREIHDTLAQGLAGIVTQLQAAEQAEHDPVEWRRHFDAATRLARESLSEARRSVDALRPEPLETAR
jgi:signal transduction histidine kinase